MKGLIVDGIALSKLIFLLQNSYVSQKIDTGSLVDSRGFVFEVEIYGFFSSTASTAVSDTIMLKISKKIFFWQKAQGVSGFKEDIYVDCNKFNAVQLHSLFSQPFCLTISC